MPRTAIVLNHPKLTVATTQAGLATGQGAECQLTSAVLSPQPVYNTIPATGCAGASQSPGLTGWQLELAWLEDWNKTVATSLSQFAFANDGLPVWYKLELDSVGMVGATATGSAYCASGGYGGTFGDGSAAATTATWPCVDKPVITPPTTPITLETEADTGADAELADAV
jgi:hypothetical protein